MGDSRNAFAKMPCCIPDYLFLNKKDSLTFVFEGKICIISLYRVYLRVIQRITGICEGTEIEYKKTNWTDSFSL